VTDAPVIQCVGLWGKRQLLLINAEPNEKGGSKAAFCIAKPMLTTDH